MSRFRDTTDGDHGQASMYDKGCRCAACRAANAQRARESRIRRKELADAGKIPETVRHGSANTARNWGCKCAACVEALRIKNAETHQRCRPRKTPKPAVALPPIGNRKMLARTCMKCGALKDAKAFDLHSRGYLLSSCRSCRREAMSDSARQKRNEQRWELTKKLQSQTLPRADKQGQQYTMVELELINRKDLTARQVASMLHRSLYAIYSQRHRIKQSENLQMIIGEPGRSAS